MKAKAYLTMVERARRSMGAPKQVPILYIDECDIDCDPAFAVSGSSIQVERLDAAKREEVIGMKKDEPHKDQPQRGGFWNRQAIIIMIQVAPPPRPACFSTDKVWTDWLIQAHVSGLKVARRIDIGKSQGCRQTSHRLLPTDQIAYCDGCTQDHQRAMEHQGRCHPSKVVVETELEHVHR